MANVSPQLIATGNINPRRFVVLATAEDFGATEANANERVIGITGDATIYPPLSDLVTTNYAATDGDSLRIFGEGDICLLEAGDTVTAGDLLKSDGDGKGDPIETTGATMQHYGAIALQEGVSGEYLLVQVHIGSVYPALS